MRSSGITHSSLPLAALVLLILSIPAYNGQVTEYGAVAIQIPNQPLKHISHIAAGGYHSLALRSDGSIVGWGWNEYGQAAPPAGNDFIAIAAGEYQSLALKESGPQIRVVNKRRIGRTVFQYDCSATFTNLWPFAMKNVQCEMLSAPDNIDMNEPTVSFGDIEFKTRQTITSVDTCTIIVDRKEAVDADKIIWRIRCNRADTGMPMELTVNGVALDGAERIGAIEEADFGDLAEMAAQWLWNGAAGQIEQDIVQDGCVNLADFAEFAAKWRGSEK